MALNSTSTASGAVSNYVASLEVVKAAVPRMAYALWGLTEELMLRSGKNCAWFLAADPVANTTPINEDGSSLTSRTLARGPVTAALQPYGDITTDTEFLQATTPADFFKLQKDWAIGSAALTIDTITRDVILADAGVVDVFANGKASGTITVTDLATLDDFAKLRAILVAAKVPTYNVQGNEVYIAIVGPYTHSQLLRNQAYRDAVAFYKNGETIPSGIVRMVAGFAFIETANVAQGTFNAIPCERNTVAGRGLYGVSALPVQSEAKTVLQGNGPVSDLADTENVSMLEKMFSVMFVGFTGQGDQSDPLNMKRTVGWKAYFAATTLRAAYGREFIAPVA